ncbi:M29 family metallopeptidase [Undibacterium rugosum]|uniref:hypothetical protein n=1 Tax=Undibacterium rugosum TaxID=2762291 RepID=UPI001E4487BA|nr:hypothetical protein [Undibacterium rugosum]
MQTLTPTANAAASFTQPTDPQALAKLASQHLSGILEHAFCHTSQQQALIVFDTQSALAHILSQAYQQCLPEAKCLQFGTVPAQDILDAIAALKKSDLVILVQSTNFRLEAYRLRVELFKRGLKVIEHPHLGRMDGEEISYYIDALQYDPVYYRETGKAIKRIIDQAGHAVIDSGEGAQLVFSGVLEPAKLNVGDYSEMANVGGQFPIGEVFTESVRLEDVNGKVRIFIFGDTSFRINEPQVPITLIVERGQVVGTENSTEEFDRVLANIRADDGVVWVRELGFGLNRAFTQQRKVMDIGTYERMCGIHLSLGSKHGSYAKPHIKRGEGRHHVDVFAITCSVRLDGQEVYQDGRWSV